MRAPGRRGIPAVTMRLQQAESDFDPLPFDAAAARAFGRVATALRRSGRKPRARAYDAMIAAVALARGLPCTPVTQATSRALMD